MKSYVGNALLLVMIWGGLVLVSGCTQSDDIVQPQLDTTITLNPVLLPDLDTLYVYELWMVKVPNNGDDYYAPGGVFTSLGKFTFKNSTSRFYDVDADTAISNAIELPESWFAYDYIVLSVENRNDPSTNPSGTYILVDEVVDPVSRPIKMTFPESMFNVLGLYFVGSPTNDTTYWDFGSNQLVRVSPLENKGLWLCSRFLTERRLHDTLAVDSLITVMVVDTFDTAGQYDPDTIGIEWPSEWLIDTTTVVFGLDTLQHRRIDVEWVVDTLPDTDVILFPYYDIDSITSVGYPYPLGDIPFYEYSGPMEELPDIQPHGWRYNAWAILEQPANGANSGLGLETVVPFGNGRQEDFTGLNSWGVLPLGGFYRPDSADLSNNYLDNREVPNFPGEDFVKFGSVEDSLRFTTLNLRRNASTRWGTILVGMEPDPSNLTVNPNVNFPLFFLADDLPSQGEPGAMDVQVFHNWSQFMPVINVSVEMTE